MKNLSTGVTDERVGAPYGFPIDFKHPDEQTDEPPQWDRFMAFFFLRDPVPCDPFSPSANFYAWASVTDGGRVTASDYAPDAAWLAPS